jgi:uncharacterized protein (UPF0548 family)
MLCWSKPDKTAVDAFLALQQNETFSYGDVGASRKEGSPAGFIVDHNRIQLGQGAATFDRAKRAIRQWKMFDMPWIELHYADTPIEPRATVAVQVRHLGFHSLNAARVVYTIEEYGPISRFGFAYGTLANHAESGEERFSVEFHEADQSVWYDLYAFSQPKTLARLAYPFTRSLQKRFARDSKSAMQRAVEAS